MVSSDRQSAQIASTLAWLEDNVRESKSQIARLAQQIEQAQGQVFNQTHRLHRSEEIAAALAAQLGVVPRLDQSLTALSDKIVRTEDRQTALETRLVELSRLQQLDADRTRVEINELIKRVDGWERLTQNWSGRLDATEEAHRRAQESILLVRQRSEEFERSVEAVDQRAGRIADGLKRVDHEFTRLNAEIEALQKQDATIFERMQVYAEIVRRFDEELAIVAQQADVRREFNERFELHRSGIRRSEERLTALEAEDESVRERLEDHQRALALVDVREKSFRDRVTTLQEELAAYRAHLAEHFQRLQTLKEKQRRRRIEEIEREVREWKVNVYRPADE